MGCGLASRRERGANIVVDGGVGSSIQVPKLCLSLTIFPSPHSPLPLRDFPEFEVQSGDPLKENIPNTPTSSYSATLIHSTLFRTHTLPRH